MTTARTIRQQVTDRLRDAVMAGDFCPEQPLRESELAERFGVSRGPVRDAFLTLSSEGFLAYQANRGVTVRQPPDPQNRAFIVSLRKQIECYVLQRGLVENPKRDLRPVEEALGQLDRACRLAEVVEVAKADMAFHQAMLMVYGGEEFLPIWKWLCSQMLIAYTRLDHYGEVFGEHTRILHALRTGDWKVILPSLEANIR